MDEAGTTVSKANTSADDLCFAIYYDPDVTPKVVQRYTEILPVEIAFIEAAET